MLTWHWAALGAVALAAFIFSFRLMKRGTATLDADRVRQIARVRKVEADLREEGQNLTAAEHLRVARAGLDDLLRLAGDPPGTAVIAAGEADTLLLRMPGADLRVSLTMRQCALGGGRMERRRGVWHLRGDGLSEDFDDLAPLMRVASARLAAHLEAATGAAPVHPLAEPFAGMPKEPPHLARRFAALAAQRKGRR